MIFQPIINQTTSLTVDTTRLKPISQTMSSLLVLLAIGLPLQGEFTKKRPRLFWTRAEANNH
jgi:hypothetical protein